VTETVAQELGRESHLLELGKTTVLGIQGSLKIYEPFTGKRPM